MNWKQIFCRHQWIRTRMRHTFATNGYILETYHQLVCEKCGKQFETKYPSNVKYKNAEKITSNLAQEEMRRILESNGTWW